MKNILIILLALTLISCQRDVKNQLGVGYNKTLIIPPTNDLPLPSANEQDKNFNNNDNLIVNSIMNNTQANNVDPKIIDKINADSGYETDENLFQKLFKGKSKR
tara:strand:- start:103 stop:414 length:312 start_codon:yes stop_codon:yes gene_type:complete